MSPAQPDASVVCPQCGAALGPQSTQCWLCLVPAVGGEAGAAAARPAPPDESWPAEAAGASPARSDAIPGAHEPFQFGLSSLMLIMTLSAVLLGVFVMAPGLGIGLAILTAPALVRTGIVAARRRQLGEPLSVKAKMSVFGGTLGLLAIIGMAATAAFVATCVPLGFAAFGLGANSDGLMVLAFVLGFAASLLVLFFLFRWFRRFWPK